MPFPTAPTVTTGELIEASDWNGIPTDLSLLKTSVADNGHLRLPSVRTITVNSVQVSTDDVVLCNGALTYTLLPAASMTNRFVIVKRIGSGTVTIDGDASDTIDGATTYDLTVVNWSVTLYCDGAKWLLL